MADRPPARASEAAPAFATPTIVHFSVVLLLSALLRAPWDSVASIAGLAGLIGLAGVAYMLITAWRMRRQTVYTPDSEDWSFHILLPFAAYAVLAGSAFAALSHEHEALFMLGGAALLLLFSAIHNAWDAGAYHVMVHRARDRDGP
jgi:nucleoside recognition membrane protein YjiH